MFGIKMLVSDGVWLKQTAVAAAESAFFSGSPDPQEFNVNHVHFQKPRENNRRRNSKSPHANQGQNNKSGSNGRHNYKSQQYYQGDRNWGGGAQYKRNNQFYSSHHQQQFGELKQHIAEARQTIQRALRHSSGRNSGGGGANGNWKQHQQQQQNRRRSSSSRNNSNSSDWNQQSGGRNSNRRDSGNSGGNWRNKQNRYNNNKNKESDPSGGFDRKRTVSFGDTISEELSGRIKQLESENTALHKTTEELEHKVVQLLERVKMLEEWSVAAK